MTDFAGDPEKRRSTTGTATYSYGGITGWMSKLQTCVALHTCEAEYVASCMAFKEAVWHRRLLLDFGYDSDDLHITVSSPLSEEEYKGAKPITVWNDNQSAISLAKNPGSRHKNNKHIEVQYHWTQSKIADGTAMLRYVNTDDNIADVFTKPLSKAAFVRHRDSMVKSLAALMAKENG